MGGFATTLLTLSLAMMGFRGVETQTVFIANLCFAAGLGMLISAQWEMVRGNTFGYSSLSAFGTLTFGGSARLRLVWLRGLRRKPGPAGGQARVDEA